MPIKKMPQPLELLAPAKDLECGMAAIDHGADAVYIGAPQFGARAAAGNSVEDIQTLCDYAHRFMARVYVTVNTIVYDSELRETRDMIGRLIDAGADALLVQDMGVWTMTREVAEEKGSRIEIHASTQTDNRTAQKVSWLAAQGASRVVLARELSVAQIAEIHRAHPEVQLEAFVHGALCVSYSGVCYASQYCFLRSANRGNCAQFCRLKFQLADADGREVDIPRYWLSLKDMCRIGWLEPLAEAGVCSFKIEGRLKDIFYVKNVVSAYSQEIDRIVARHPDRYRRASLGHSTCRFQPSLQKTFNRGFTDYFASGERTDIASVDTPKALGEYVGKVKEIRRDSFNVAGTAAFANGDGLCFFDRQRRLCGFRVNRVESNRIYPLRMPEGLQPGCALYRNSDVAFERMLSRQSAERRIPVDVCLDAMGQGLRLCMKAGETDLSVTATVDGVFQPAQKPQSENIYRQMSRLGNTVFELRQLDVDQRLAEWFIPSSVLAELRREAATRLSEAIVGLPRHDRPVEKHSAPQVALPLTDEYRAYPYLLNVSNQMARRFYDSQGLEVKGDAFELGGQRRVHGPLPLLMQCRHCIRYTLGFCTKDGRRLPWREPLSLRLPDGRAFPLKFDCKKCQMNVYAQR